MVVSCTCRETSGMKYIRCVCLFCFSMDAIISKRYFRRITFIAVHCCLIFMIFLFSESNWNGLKGNL